MRELGIGKPMLQVTIAGDQQQAFTVMVQTSGRIHVCNRNILLERVAFTRELALGSKRFVEQDVTMRQATSLPQAVAMLAGGL